MSLILSGTDGLSDVDGTAATPAIRGTDANTGIFFGADIIGFSEGGVEAARFDSSGNFGLGVTPSAWTNYKAIQLGGGSLSSYSDNNYIELSQNGYYASGVYKYVNTGYASKYQQNTGTHQWYVAASGTAGNAITFTQAMTLDASGNLGVGTTSPTQKLDVNGVVTTTPGLGSSGAFALGYGSNAASRSWRMRIDDAAFGDFSIQQTTTQTGSTYSTKLNIDSSGRLLVGTTSQLINESSMGVSSSGNTATFKTTGGTGTQPLLVWNSGSSGTRELIALGAGSSWASQGTISSNGSVITYGGTSDYRLKENVQPMTGALDKVIQLKPCTFIWKNTGIEDNGFIAHELQEICPNAVVGEKDAVNEDGSIKAQQIDTSFLVATLTAAIQEQQAIITTLTARITALESA